MAIRQSKLLKDIAQILTKRGLTLSICESCTGGMLGSFITSIPGSSKFFFGGIIAYSDQVKMILADVTRTALKKYGAMSTEVAVAMARGTRTKLKTDIGIGITGIAGPSGGSKTKPIGLVYTAIDSQNKTLVKKFLFGGSRTVIRKKACQKALLLLNKFFVSQ